MALLLLRRSILCQISAQTHTRNGCLRSQSSTTCDSSRALSSIGEDQINSSLRTQPSNADPRDDVDKINLLASFVTGKVDDIIKYGEPRFPLLFGAEFYAHHRYEGRGYPEVLRWNCISNQLLYLIKDFPEVDKIQIFHAKIYYESLLRDESKCELTKDEITARVLNVIKCYPKVTDYQVVTEETHFGKDLGFDKWDVTEIIQALQVEFKLDIRDDIDSCKLAIQYIYDHHMEKLCLEEFRKRFHFTPDSGRRIYLRADEKMGTKDTMFEIFHAKIYYESLLRDKSKCELTKDEITARVLNVIRCYPKVADYQVLTEGTHFCNDLGFDKRDVFEIIQALQVEFKLDIPDDIDSCKLAIEYIYDHRMEKLCFEEFRKRFHFVADSGRRIYLRADEKMLESGRDKLSRETNWDGINLTQFYLNMQSNYFPDYM